MLQNYVLVAWRNLRSRVGPTAINVVGLAVGLAACLLIGLWVQHEFSYDDFHPDADRIYRLASDVKLQDRALQKADAPAPLASVVENEIPEVVAATHFRHREAVTIQRRGQAFADRSVVYADSTFFNVFGGFELLRGSPETALDGTNALVLTASTAETIFGRLDVVGETLEIDGEAWRVTGVMADVPNTSHMRFQAVGTLQVPPDFNDNWTGLITYTYVKLTEGASLPAFEQKLKASTREYIAPQIEEGLGVSFEKFLEQGSRWGFFAQPLTSIHLHSTLGEEIEANGSITTVYVFGAIGLFILLIACINFVNLVTARAAERATEVGMRKALGAARPQLLGQFFGEAILTTAAAAVLAAIIAGLVLPVFNDLAGTRFGLGAFLEPTVLLGLLGLVAVVGLVAGSYPAVILSRFAPAEALKSGQSHTSSQQGRRLRQGLVVFQFAISIALIVGTLVAGEQFAYVQSKRLGLEKEQVVAVEEAGALGERQASFVRRLQQAPGVVASGAGGGLFTRRVPEQGFVPDQQPDRTVQPLKELTIGVGFVETLGIDVVAGRTFESGRPSDSTAVLINETAAQTLGWDDPLGHTLAEPGDSVSYEVIGVVGDFHFQSMRDRIRPLALFLGDTPKSVYARLAPGSTSEALSDLEGLWSQAAPQRPFQYSFLDQTYDQLHRDVQRASTLFMLFAGLAVIIACLGLFGLATYTVQRRRKEIGIRKALGATATQVVGLLSKQFLTLVGVGAGIALPLAYWAMAQWLQGFAYRTTVGVGVLTGAALLAGLIAFLAIGYHALQAARLDPATTLRDE